MTILDIGAGPDTSHGDCVRIDVMHHYRPDVVADCLNLPFRDDAFDSIYASDVLEHLPWVLTRLALREWKRVLDPDGVIEIRVPDFVGLLKRANNGDASYDMAFLNWSVMGTPEIPGMGHQTLFDEAKLRDDLHQTGFEIVDLRRDPHPNLIATCIHM